MVNIIKIGGNIIDDPLKLDQFLKDFAHIEDRKILIHGGGKIATEVSKHLGIEAQMFEGKRITDAETLKVVTMVYAGLINKNIVARLQSLDCNALGLTGADLKLITGKQRKSDEIDWGFVGDVTENSVETDALKTLLDLKINPVFCALTHNGLGQLLNTNADAIAYCLAASLAKKGITVRLIYCFEKKGVMYDVNDPNSVISSINSTLYTELKSKGIIHSGMIPKLDNAFKALQTGVSEVKICMAEDLHTVETAGTTLTLH